MARRSAHANARAAIRADGGESKELTGGTGHARGIHGGGGARRGEMKWNPRVPEAPWVRLNRA